MEGCDTYKPWHDKQTHKTYLRPDKSQCLHSYFYFMDAELGLIHLRVFSWAPFRLQFYCTFRFFFPRDGDSRLVSQLAAEGSPSPWPTCGRPLTGYRNQLSGVDLALREGVRPVRSRTET